MSNILTEQQFQVITVLMDLAEKPGSEIREQLAKEGSTKSLAAFYQLAGRMEESKLIRGKNYPERIDGVTINERRYKLTPNGQRAWQRTLEFYMDRAKAVGGVV